MPNTTNQAAGTEGCEHVQTQGMAYYDANCGFFFAPEFPIPDTFPTYRSRGVAQQMSDGTFEFVPVKRIRSHSKLIKKVAHGRLSETADGAILLTLKIGKDEVANLGYTLWSETHEILSAIVYNNK